MPRSLVAAYANHDEETISQLVRWCVPMGRDQDDNAARVAAFGAGVRLNPRATTDQLKNAVASVLDSPRFRKSARRLASAIESRTGEVDVVTVIESIGRPRDPGNRAA